MGIGHEPFIWWIGVVEDRMDPLKLGRCRVRIVGHHTEDKTILPTSELPWAHPIAPINNSSPIIQAPKEGTMVTGYFMDSSDGQFPVMWGQFSGVDTVSSKTGYGFHDPRSGAQLQLAPVKKGLGQKAVPYPRVLEQPNTPYQSRGVVSGGLVDKANKNRLHICDPSLQMKARMLAKKIKNSQLAMAIRKAIQAIIKQLGFTPDGVVSRYIEIAKQILRDLKFIQSIIDEIKNFIKVIVELVKKLRALIDWILSLPAKLYALLKDCLSNVLKAIGAFFSELFSGVGGAESKELSELQTLATQILNTTKDIVNDTVTIAKAPQTIVTALTTPASAADIAAAGTLVENYILTIPNNSSNTVNQLANTTSNVEMA